MSRQLATEQYIHTTLFTLKICVCVCVCILVNTFQKVSTAIQQNVLVASFGKGSVSKDWDVTLSSIFFSINSIFVSIPYFKIKNEKNLN